MAELEQLSLGNLVRDTLIYRAEKSIEDKSNHFKNQESIAKQRSSYYERQLLVNTGAIALSLGSVIKIKDAFSDMGHFGRDLAFLCLAIGWMALLIAAIMSGRLMLFQLREVSNSAVFLRDFIRRERAWIMVRQIGHLQRELKSTGKTETVLNVAELLRALDEDAKLAGKFIQEMDEEREKQREFEEKQSEVIPWQTSFALDSSAVGFLFLCLATLMVLIAL